MKNEIVKLAVILLIISGVATGALAYTNELTYPKIIELRAQTEAQARMNVMPDTDEITETVDADQVKAIAAKIGAADGEVNEIYVAKKGGKIVGYTVKCTVNGFAGGVGVLTGVSVDGKITGAAVLVHSETPGLGAKAAEKAWISQYDGKSTAKEITVIKTGTPKDSDIVAISGATITSRAVTKAVNYARLAFLELKGGK